MESASSPSGMLDEHSARDYLASREILSPPVRVTPLAGGVSNTVLLAEDVNRQVVLKQSLPRLRVEEEWLADQRRLLTEGRALALCGELTPGSIPSVIHVDAEMFVLVIEAAPPSWRNWKEHLLNGDVDLTTAAGLGSTVGRWHRATTGDPQVRSQFDEAEAFEQLRVDPYYRTIARRVPYLAEHVAALIEEMTTARSCLVHGDFSPKNVLVGDGRFWVLDFEVAHFGDPAFDLAFVTSHLALKAMHLPAARSALRAAVEQLWTSYGPTPPVERVMAHTGALMVARVEGKSPVDYLDFAQSEAVLAVGTQLLREPPDRLDGLWSLEPISPMGAGRKR